jgi:zinc protease
LSDSLLRPRLAPTEFATLRARQIELIKAVKESDPAELLGTYGRAFLFGQHPFGLPVAGSEASLAAIEFDDILNYRRCNFGADRLTLIVSGDLDTVLLKRTVGRLFTPWQRAAQPAQRLPRPSAVQQRRVLIVDSPGSAQTYFWIGSVGVDRHAPARAALDLANTLYGGRFTSILNSELRVKSGLSYGARSGFTRGSVPGEFAIRSFAGSRDTGKALEIALETLTELKRKIITPEMLDSARAYLLGQFPLEFETAMDWAVALGELALFGLSTTYIEEYAQQLRAVSLQDLDAVIQSAFPTPENVVIVLIGDRAAIRDQIPAQWPVRYSSLAQPDFTATEGFPLGARAAALHA